MKPLTNFHNEVSIVKSIAEVHGGEGNLYVLDLSCHTKYMNQKRI